MPNPTIHEAMLDDLAPIEEISAAVGVRVPTLRVWESRGKIARMPIPGGVPLYHLPTIEAAAAATRREHTPRDPAANARGPHRTQARAA